MGSVVAIITLIAGLAGGAGSSANDGGTTLPPSNNTPVVTNPTIPGVRIPLQEASSFTQNYVTLDTTIQVNNRQYAHSVVANNTNDSGINRLTTLYVEGLNGEYRSLNTKLGLQDGVNPALAHGKISVSVFNKTGSRKDYDFSVLRGREANVNIPLDNSSYVRIFFHGFDKTGKEIATNGIAMLSPVLVK
ncbi:MAG: hypothetical protein SOW59_02840 [Corynebacterium sp.]|nr:hypothetical protein [Corynebacterium sp.]